MNVGQAILYLDFDAGTTATATTDFALSAYAVEFWFDHPDDTTGATDFSLEITETNDAGTQTLLDLDTETIASFARIAAPVRQLTDNAGADVTGMYGAYLMCGKITVTMTYDSAVTGQAKVAIRYTT